MATTTAALDASRERLRATVAATLADVYDRTTDPDTAEQAIMDAVQRWNVEGYEINAAPAAPCPGSGATVSRWHSRQNPLDPMSEWTADPGPYAEGERVTCRHCSADVPVTPVANTLRSAGRQYVGRLAQH